MNKTMKKFLRQEYIKELGHSSFNKYNKNEYSNWLEKKLTEALNITLNKS